MTRLTWSRRGWEWGSPSHHNAATRCCPRRMWSCWLRSWLTASGTGPVLPVETRLQRGLQVHCRTGRGPLEPPACSTFSRARSAWRSCSRKTTGCPGALSVNKEEKEVFSKLGLLKELDLHVLQGTCSAWIITKTDVSKVDECQAVKQITCSNP